MELTNEYLIADKIGNSHVVVISAPPRSGKTTRANDFIKRGFTPICRDDIRRALGVRFKRELEDDVNRYTNVMLETMLIRGVPFIVIDETNLTKKNRRKLTELIKKHNGSWSFVVIEPPDESTHKEICNKTNFPWAVVEEHKNRWEPIGPEECHEDYPIDRKESAE